MAKSANWAQTEAFVELSGVIRNFGSVMVNYGYSYSFTDNYG